MQNGPSGGCHFGEAEKYLSEICNDQNFTRGFSLTWDQFSTIGALAVARGDTTGAFLSSEAAVQNKLRSIYNCVPWNPFPIDTWTGEKTEAFVQTIEMWLQK